MVKIYASLVFNGIKTIDQVPIKLRLAVEMEVEKMKAGG